MGRTSGSGVGWALVALPVLVIVAVVLSLRKPEAPPTAPVASERYPNAWPGPPPPEVARLLGDLGPLPSGWRIRGVSPVHEQRIVVDVEKGEAGFRVAVMLKERDSRRPPKATARYALYTLQPRPTEESIQEHDYAEVLGALATRIQANEAGAPVPSGM